MRASAVCLITTGTLLLMGCTCASEPLPEGRSDASAERSGAARASTRCELGSAQQTLPAASDMAADEEASDLFSVEVGSALVHSTGFWVPWMSGDGRASSVGLTFLTPALSQARTVSLGAVHWDAAPPRAAHLGEDELLVVVPDADASGDSYRVARVSKGQASWGADLDGSSDDSASFDLAATSQSALLVWDDYHRERGLGTIRGVVLDHTAHLSQDLGVVSPSTSDAESPRLAAHKTGYWLGWLSVALQPSAEQEPSHSEVMAMRPSQRWIEVLPLDEQGRAVGEAMAVSSRDAMVQGFDMQAGHDGSLLLSWREDFANAGTSGGKVFMARLTAGGSLERYPVDGTALGGTLPTLLFDPRPPSGVPHAWLTLEAAGGDSALAALSPMGEPLQLLVGDIGLGVASALGALQGELLLAKPKGRDVVFSLARCKYTAGTYRPDAGR